MARGPSGHGGFRDPGGAGSHKGRDTYLEASLGVAWSFRERCGLRLQYAFSQNRSNIDIYDFDRHEVSSTIRCDMF
jgi:hypothetical protein